MREIKFRAWDNKSNMMASWEEIDTMDTDGLLPFLEILGSPDWTVEQYIGLKDKNDKEIYEGDIVDPHGGNLKAVMWVDTGFKLVNYQGTAGFVDQFNYCSVVGNIHKNPELLAK